MKIKYPIALAISLASQSHAAFDPGSLILMVHDPEDGDKFFWDIGSSAAQAVNGNSFSMTSSSLAAFISSNTLPYESGVGGPPAVGPNNDAYPLEWGLIGSTNSTAPVAGPPALGQSYENRGLLGSSSQFFANQSNITGSALLNDQALWLERLSELKAAAPGSDELIILGADPMTQPANPSVATDQDLWFDGAFLGIGVSNKLWYLQTSPLPGAILSDEAAITELGSAVLSADGTFSYSTVPVPASAWLFLSACGALFVRSKSGPVGRKQPQR